MSHVGTALIDPYKIFEKVGLSQGMRVADLGCGRTGHFIFPAARVVGETGVIYAVDIMKDILESIKSRIRSEGYDNIQTVWADLEAYGKIPIPANSLDICFFVNVFFMLKKKTEALQEAHRLLKENGFLVIVDWTKKLGLLGPDPGLAVNPQELAKIAAEFGLSLVEDCSAGEYHFCLIFAKKGK